MFKRLKCIFGKHDWKYIQEKMYIQIETKEFVHYKASKERHCKLCNKVEIKGVLGWY